MLYFGSGAFHQQKVRAMGVRIADPATISWIWHDAALAGVQIDWAPNGDMDVVFHTELHPDEDRAELISLGIASRVVSIHVGMVWRFHTESTGDYAGRSTIDQWDVRTQSSFLARVNERRPPLAGLLHHHITTSSGSIFDIVGTDIQIATRETPVNAGRPPNGSVDSSSAP
jgi:hypothetical protein